MGRGLDTWRGLGAQCHLGFFSCPLAELEIMCGRPERGLEVVAGAISEIEATDEGLSKTYLGAERGRLLRIVEDPIAEAVLRKAVADADKMGARVAELQARTELARLLAATDRTAEGIGILETAVFTFADGIATPALVAAQEVFDRLRA